MEQFTFR